MQPLHNYQNALHAALRGFMEFESVTPPTRFLYPFFDQHRNPTHRLLALLEQFPYPLADSRQILAAHASKKTLSTVAYATLLCTLLADFYGTVPFQKLNRKKTAMPRPTIPVAAWGRAFAEKDAGLFKKTMRVISPLTDFSTSAIAGFFVHGSLATLDYEKNFSDFDSILIIKKNTIPNELVLLRKKLLRAYALMYAVDPAQHHGIPVLYESELEYYPEHYFPLAVLRDAVPVVPFSSSSSTVFVRDDAEERIARVEKNAAYFSALANKNPRWMSIYTFKLVVAKVLLLPTLFLQAQGTPSLKKDSFHAIQKHLSPDLIHLLDSYSTLRKEWPACWFSCWSARLLGLLGNPFLPKIGTYLNLRRVPPFFLSHAALLARTLEAKLHERTK
ncbi:MAG: hypothetical protein Q7R76_06505 [Candidatus Woesearchaeota archaeon]|nr:hypothetical protein [Candidatus Woesearchaeota archaeon]